MPPPNFLIESCEGLRRDQHTGPCLLGLLIGLQSCATSGLPAPAVGPIPSGGELIAFRRFMDGLPRDRVHFILLDEVQKLFLLTRTPAVAGGAGGAGSDAAAAPELDTSAIMQMRE